MKERIGLNQESDIYFCEHCEESFNWTQVIVENDQPRCPHCGSVVKQALPRTNRKGKK